MSSNNNSMDPRTIFGIVLAVLFVIGYNQYLGKKYPPTKTTTTTNSTTAPKAETPISSATTPGTSDTAVVAAEEVKQLSPDELTFETDTNIYRFSQELGAITSVKLKTYRTGKADDSPQVELLDSPLVVSALAYGPGATPDPKQVPVATQGQWNAERKAELLRLWRVDGVWEIAQEFNIPATGYAGKLDIVFTNKSNQQQDLTGAIRLHEVLSFKPTPKVLGILPGTPGEIQALVSSVHGKATHTDLQKHCEDSSEAAVEVKNDQVDYFGIDSHYFLKVFEPAVKASNLVVQKTHANEGSCGVTIIGYQAAGFVQPGESIRMSYSTYFGPKDITIMQTYNEDLESTVDLGFFSFFAKPLLTVIHGFYKFFGNYGVSIIILTLLLKILFYPLMKASAVSMHKMKKLNPQMAELREKYKDDKQRQQQELMKFMAANKVNPMKGCLPMLPQIPVFFAFYQVLRSAIELRHAPFYGWIQDLAAMDPYFVTPILMGIAMLVQQKLTPTTGMDKTQEKILMFMPIMFTAMMMTLPSGMTLYMLTNTVIGILQQRWLYRKLDKLNA